MSHQLYCGIANAEDSERSGLFLGAKVGAMSLHADGDRGAIFSTPGARPWTVYGPRFAGLVGWGFNQHFRLTGEFAYSTLTASDVQFETGYDVLTGPAIDVADVRVRTYAGYVGADWIHSLGFRMGFALGLGVLQADTTKYKFPSVPQYTGSRQTPMLSMLGRVGYDLLLARHLVLGIEASAGLDSERPEATAGAMVGWTFAPVADDETRDGEEAPARPADRAPAPTSDATRAGANRPVLTARLGLPFTGYDGTIRLESLSASARLWDLFEAEVGQAYSAETCLHGFTVQGRIGVSPSVVGSAQRRGWNLRLPLLAGPAYSWMQGGSCDANPDERVQWWTAAIGIDGTFWWRRSGFNLRLLVGPALVVANKVSPSGAVEETTRSTISSLTLDIGMAFPM